MGDLQLKGYSREKGISDNRKSRRIALAERVCVAQVRSWEKAESVQHRGREGLGGEALSKTQVWWDSCLLSHDLTELKPHSVPPHEKAVSHSGGRPQGQQCRWGQSPIMEILKEGPNGFEV